MRRTGKSSEKRQYSIIPNAYSLQPTSSKLLNASRTHPKPSLFQFQATFSASKIRFCSSSFIWIVLQDKSYINWYHCLNVLELRPLRQKLQELSIDHTDKKQSYDSVAAGLDSTVGKLERDVNVSRNFLFLVMFLW